MGIGLAVSGTAQAFCGGTPVHDNDCDSNNLAYAESCCPQGYRVHGVVYNDLKGQDNTDAIGAMCRKYGTMKGAETLIASDFYNRGNKNKNPIQLMCEPGEVMAGIACKDLDKKDDALDGCTAVCQVPGQEKRLLSNPDLDGNKRDYVYHTVDLPNRVWGIGYKEEKLDTDRADCGNISYQYMPIVK